MGLRSADQSLFSQMYPLINCLAVLCTGKNRLGGKATTRPMIGRVNTECAASVKSLVSQTIDVGRPLEGALDFRLDVFV